MLTRIVSQGRSHGNPQFTVQLCHEPDEAPYFEGTEIAGMLEIYRDPAGMIYAKVTILEYVPPKASTAKA